MIEGKKCSSVVLKTRKIGKWVDVNTDDIFKGKKVVIFSLPGAFTPVCSEKQLPGFEKNYDKLLSLGINEVYCISVNDGFVMNAWADQQKLTKVKVLPDGNAEFTEVDKIVVKNGVKIMGETNILNKLPVSASNLYSKNVFNFVTNLYDKENKKININLEDEIINKTLIK